MKKIITGIVLLLVATSVFPQTDTVIYSKMYSDGKTFGRKDTVVKRLLPNTPGKYITGYGTFGSLIDSTGGGSGGLADSAYFFSLNGNAPAFGKFLGTTISRSLRFRTNNVERLIIDSVGKVGIGIAPVNLLDVYSSVNGASTMRFQNANTGTSAFAGVQIQNNTGSSYIYMPVASGYTTANLSNTLIFQNANSGDIVLHVLAEGFRLKSNGSIVIPAVNTATGTTGARTINLPTGKVNFAAGATTLVVTNSLVTTASIVMVTVEGSDATATSARVTLAAGSFTITLNAAATAETKVSFFVIN